MFKKRKKEELKLPTRDEATSSYLALVVPEKIRQEQVVDVNSKIAYSLPGILNDNSLGDGQVGYLCSGFDLREYSNLLDKKENGIKLTEEEGIILAQYENILGVSGRDFWRIRHYLDLEKCWDYKLKNRTYKSEKTKTKALKASILRSPSEEMTFNQLSENVRAEVRHIRESGILIEDECNYEFGGRTISFEDPRNYFDEDALLAIMVQEISPQDYTPAGRVEIFSLLLNAGMRVDGIPSLNDRYASCGAYQMTHSTYSSLFEHEMVRLDEFEKSIMQDIIDKKVYFAELNDEQAESLSVHPEMDGCIGIEMQTRASFYLGYYNFGRFMQNFMNENDSFRCSKKLVTAWNKASAAERKMFIISVTAAMHNSGEKRVFAAMGQALGDCPKHRPGSKYRHKAVPKSASLDKIRVGFSREIGTVGQIASRHSRQSTDLAEVLIARRTDEPSPTMQLGMDTLTVAETSSKDEPVFDKEKFAKYMSKIKTEEPVVRDTLGIEPAFAVADNTSRPVVFGERPEEKEVEYKMGKKHKLIPRTDGITGKDYYTFSMPDWEEYELSCILEGSSGDVEPLKEFNHEEEFTPRADMRELVLVPVEMMDENLRDGYFVSIYVKNNNYEKMDILLEDICRGRLEENRRTVQIYTNYYDEQNPPEWIRVPIGILKNRY